MTIRKLLIGTAAALMLALQKANQKMQLTFSDPPFSGYVLEVTCFGPDGTIISSRN
jgi:hypothetical protein